MKTMTAKPSGWSLLWLLIYFGSCLGLAAVFCGSASWARGPYVSRLTGRHMASTLQVHDVYEYRNIPTTDRVFRCRITAIGETLYLSRELGGKGRESWGVIEHVKYGTKVGTWNPETKQVDPL